MLALLDIVLTYSIPASPRVFQGSPKKKAHPAISVISILYFSHCTRPTTDPPPIHKPSASTTTTMPSAMPPTPPPVAPPTLPSPQPFDVLISLNALLHRLLADVPTSDDHEHDPTSQLNSRHAPLVIKDFSAEALKVKNTLNEARRALQSLPDLDKSLLEQEAQIRKLERAIERKREMLRKVGTAGGMVGEGEGGEVREEGKMMD